MSADPLQQVLPADDGANRSGEKGPSAPLPAGAAATRFEETLKRMVDEARRGLNCAWNEGDEPARSAWADLYGALIDQWDARTKRTSKRLPAGNDRTQRAAGNNAAQQD